jgi:hypothetical protein
VTRLAIFAYASLVDPESAGETLGRRVEPAAMTRLAGWRRRWSVARDNRASEKSFARADNGSLPRFCLGLNLEAGADEDEAPNGALIEVTEAELERLDLREMRYRRLDVTDAVANRPARIDRVLAYTARPERFAPSPPEGAVIIATYPRAVEAAFDALGRNQLELYHRTTQPPPVPVIDAVLVDDHIPRGNPREW